MSAKTDVEAIRLIGEEVVRLLSLPELRLEAEAREGLILIANLAQWRAMAFGPEPAIRHHVR
ncbi:hypothetical protein OH720_18640 [Pseudomonas sp. WJP1]|uniref:hypothetical protein n=1 Tax=Pseudomonas sp. WJP1 TaxID=2986947 RepID=UPI00234957A4|nr:hypothetical protein [Pseudomonas sp. WJP1]WCM49026.1 hypothetical protein OH720_18640 [Pseudomonas sp. WJP1]